MRRNVRTGIFGQLALSFALLLCCRGASAAEAPGTPPQGSGGDTLCFHFTSRVQGCHLELESGYLIGGILPMTYCDFRSGSKYRMYTDGQGLDRSCATFTVDMAGNPHVTGIRTGVALRNALLPGWGSSHADAAVKGWMDGLTIAAVAWFLWDTDREFRHLENRHDILDGLLEEAGTLQLREHYGLAVREAALDANAKNKHRKRLAYLGAAMYGHQILDAWLSHGPPKTSLEAGGNVVRVTPAASSRAKAFVHSLVRPGRGQFYQGKKVRGGMFSLLATAAGILALDYHGKYDMEVVDYKIMIQRFDESESLDEREILKQRAEREWEDVEHTKLNRDIAYIALAGIWGWNLLDTLFPSSTPSMDAGHAFEIAPGGMAVVIRF